MAKFVEQPKEYLNANENEIFIGNKWKDKNTYGTSIYGRIVNLEVKEFPDKDKNGKDIIHKRPSWTIQIWDEKSEKPLNPEKFVKTPAHADLVAGMGDLEITDVVKIIYNGPGEIKTSPGMWPTYTILKDTDNSPSRKIP